MAAAQGAVHRHRAAEGLAPQVELALSGGLQGVSGLRSSAHPGLQVGVSRGHLAFGR